MMIENSDRGITLNKTLAWTLAVALMSGGMWVGTTVASLERELASIRDLAQQLKDEGAARETRLRHLENTFTRSDERQLAQSDLLARIDARLERLERTLSERYDNGRGRQ